jgi:hypothetical protein
MTWSPSQTVAITKELMSCAVPERQVGSKKVHIERETSDKMKHGGVRLKHHGDRTSGELPMQVSYPCEHESKYQPRNHLANKNAPKLFSALRVEAALESL